MMGPNNPPIHKYEGETIVNGMRQPPRTEYDSDGRRLDAAGVPMPLVQATPEERARKAD